MQINSAQLQTGAVFVHIKSYSCSLQAKHVVNEDLKACDHDKLSASQLCLLMVLNLTSAELANNRIIEMSL